MKIVIVGGGIAGLSAAISLRSPRRSIIVLEKSQMLKETGALISLQPNASKIVSTWGIDSFLAPSGPMVDKAFRLFDKTGKLEREMKLDFAEFGADRILYHRQDLHTALKNAATSPDLPGKPAEIRTASAVTGCDADEGTVTINGNEKIDADIIIGADGIRSVVRKFLVGDGFDAIPTGISAYRMLVPIEALKGIQIPEGAFEPAEAVTTMIVGHDRRVIMGPGRNSTVFGIVALVPDSLTQGQSSPDSWVNDGSIGAVLDAFQDFPSWLLEIFKRAPEHALWQLRDIDPLPTWVQGRTLLIGDAAHAMLPTQGQGASQAIEDAEALDAFLGDLPDKATKEDVNKVLVRVFESRFGRASLIQRYSREQARPGTDGDSKKVKLDPGEFMKFNCDYSGAKDWMNRVKQGTVNL
ncbi:unnamed protein product [Clonostachys rhizophaga]|uniref:FAD-binding domain-containing protein n=1 Tax=Clonostachys rhizophaga TaxID=160324 RepID=A0A9N9V8U5_9HYPO|nr:unnamed protein product [Clonostachys rhizophaga]